MALPPIPATVAATMIEAIRVYGEALDYLPNGGMVATTLRGLVQRPGIEGLIADASQDFMTIWLAGPDVPKQPERFDRIEVAGTSYSIDDALPHRLNGAVVAWELRCGG